MSPDVTGHYAEQNFTKSNCMRYVPIRSYEFQQQMNQTHESSSIFDNDTIAYRIEIGFHEHFDNACYVGKCHLIFDESVIVHHTEFDTTIKICYVMRFPNDQRYLNLKKKKYAERSPPLIAMQTFTTKPI